MEFKILFLFVFILMMFFSTIGISLAEVKISDMPTSEKIQNFIPKPLTELFKMFNNINLDFLKLPFFNRVAESIPKSGEEIGNSFQKLTSGLEIANNWLKKPYRAGCRFYG